MRCAPRSGASSRSRRSRRRRASIAPRSRRWPARTRRPGGRGVRRAWLVWPRVRACPHRADRRRARRARGGGRRRRGGALRGRGRLPSGGRAASRNRARASRRSRSRSGVRDDAEARDLRRAAELYEPGKRKEAAAIFAPLRLARGEARRRVRGLAGERGPDRAARRALSAQRARPAPRRARALLGGHRRGADRLARGPRRRARHALRGARGRSDLRQRLRARAARLHRQLRLPDRGRDAGGAARAACGRPDACAAGSSTGSRCSGSAGRSRRGAPSPRRVELAPNDVDALVADAVGRYDKSESLGGVLAARPAHPPFPATRRRCASTSGCCCSGSETCTRRSASSARAQGRAGEPDRRARRSGTSSGSQRRDRLNAKMGRTAYGASERSLASSRSFVRRVLRIAEVATTVSAIGGGAEVSAGGTHQHRRAAGIRRAGDHRGKGAARERQAGRQADRGGHRERARRARPRRGADGRVLLGARGAADRGRRPGRAGGRGRGGARGLDRHAAALPQGHRQGAAADRGAGGRAGEADRARRARREAGDGRGEPPPRRLDREALPQPGAARSST